MQGTSHILVFHMEFLGHIVCILPDIEIPVNDQYSDQGSRQEIGQIIIESGQFIYL